MARTIRFHLDENCHRAIAEGLRRRGVDVTTTPEVGLLHASDEKQIAYALPLGRVIFTQDRDFLRLHAASVSPSRHRLLRQGHEEHRRNYHDAHTHLGGLRTRGDGEVESTAS